MQKFTNAHHGPYTGLLSDYQHGGFYCELYGQAENELNTRKNLAPLAAF